MSIEMDQLLLAVVKHGASDLHLRVGAPPKIRLRGSMRSLGNTVLTPDMTMALMKSITSEKHQQELAEVGSTDFALAFQDQARFRVSAFRAQGNIGLVMRQIPNKILSIEQIGLPEAVKELCDRPRGLFLVTGPTGSGKTTTLCSMIDYINSERSDHIITVEDPIEFVHQHKKCIITQREIGPDTTSFSEALRRALRQDPDIILVGEMRDLETIEAAVTAAETGHLVFGTLHTTSASKTIDRLVQAFPTTQQEQIRTQLATGLIAVLSQQLLKTKDGKGRVAAYELLIALPAVQNLIREKETFKIDSVIQTSAKQGMIMLDDPLFQLYQEGRVEAEEAISKANYTDQLRQKIGRWEEEQAKLAAKRR